MLCVARVCELIERFFVGIRRILNIPEPKRALPAASTTNDVPSSSPLTPEYQEAVDTLQQGELIF